MGIAAEQGKTGLEVVGTGEPEKSQGWRALRDGTVTIAVGYIVVGGFLVESLKSIVTGDPNLWSFVGLIGAGLLAFGVGWYQRIRLRRLSRVGIVVTAADEVLGIARARTNDAQATAFSERSCTLTLRASVDLASGSERKEQVNELAAETMSGVRIAEKLTPDLAQINLIPTMPLHVGFWFGAQLGLSTREIVIHGTQQGKDPLYFPATTLRPNEKNTRKPLSQEQTSFHGGDPTVTALALDLQGLGDQFSAPVRKACQQHHVHALIELKRPDYLPNKRKIFSAAVEQAWRAWRDVELSDEARTGHHLIFLSGPVAVSIALGARLASNNQASWTAYSFNRNTGVYEPFPSPAPGTKSPIPR